MHMRKDAERIIREALSDVRPGEAVRRALTGRDFGTGRLILVSAGKAAWSMAEAALQQLGDRIGRGIVITKYGHSRGSLPRCEILEAGHPVPDDAAVLAADKALALTADLTAEDTVLFLLSGGGSALFEKPLIPLRELQSVTAQLLKSGADIVEMNTVRKRLSAVKGGRFADHCRPARVLNVILSDVLGDPVDMIASGPAAQDRSTSAEALAVAEKYGLLLSPEAEACLRQETPRRIGSVEHCITGSVRALCRSAERTCRALGYAPCILTDNLTMEARAAGRMLAETARAHQDTTCSLAFIAGGETLVHVTGTGLGGRNQELALAAASGLDGCRDTLLFSLGSDGTDGPTDAAGGLVTGKTAEDMRNRHISIEDTLRNNDAYHALQAVNGLIMTGAMGTNVNDLTVLLIRR